MHSPEQSPFLLTNNENIKDPETVPNAFNTFYPTVADNLNLHQEGTKCAFSLLKDASPERFHSIKIIATTETEIKSIIHSL
jgi:hypothetical protein